METKSVTEQRLEELEGTVQALREEVCRQKTLLALKDLLAPQSIIVIDFHGPGTVDEEFRRRKSTTCMLCKGWIGSTDEVCAVRYKWLTDVNKGRLNKEEIGHIHVDCFGAAIGSR